jgi:hypothetical protein
MRGSRTYRRALCALLVAMTLGLTATPPAGAATGCFISSFTPRLTVARNFQRYSVDVSGVLPMTQEQAQGLINSGVRVQWRLWGDDPVFDDFLFGPDPASIASSPGALGLSSTTQGLAFKGARVTTGGTLDEDDSFFDHHDELYGAVRLLNSSGGLMRCGKSNVVGGYF